MSLTSQFKTDPVVENNGVECKYAANKDGTVPTIVIARAGKSNKEYQRTLNSAMKPYQRANQLGTLDSDVADDVYMGVFIRTCIKGWSNINLSDVTGNKDDKGFAEFNFDNAKALFTRLPEFYDDLTDKANTASMFREAILEEDAKKLNEVLAYALSLGKDEQLIAKRAMQNGQPIPESILNAPELRPGLYLFLEAYFDLDSERTHIYSPTAIPRLKIIDYAKAFGFDDEQTQDLFYFIKSMDSEHLKRIDKKDAE